MKDSNVSPEDWCQASPDCGADPAHMDESGLGNPLPSTAPSWGSTTVVVNLFPQLVAVLNDGRPPHVDARASIGTGRQCRRRHSPTDKACAATALVRAMTVVRRSAPMTV